MTGKRKRRPQGEVPAATGEAASEPVPNKTVVWDDKEMRTSYANVINVLCTREEFSLFFGTNQTWNLAESPGLEVNLGSRILLTPYAAKRLQLLLTDRLAGYRKRF